MTIGNETSRTPAISSSGTSIGNVADSARRSTSDSLSRCSELTSASMANAPRPALAARMAEELEARSRNAHELALHALARRARHERHRAEEDQVHGRARG